MIRKIYNYSEYYALSNEIRILKSLQFSTSKNESSASVNSDSKQFFVVILWHGDSCALYYVMWIFLNPDYVTDGNY